MLDQKYIQLIDRVDDWRAAIRIGAQPLLDNEIINQNYIEQMIKNVETMGPYIVISKDVAIPHARPEDGALKPGLALLKSKTRVKFSDDKDVNVLIVLASSNSDEHLKLLKKVVEILSNKENYNNLINAESIEEIYQIWCQNG